MAKEYFSHDYNARNDRKIAALVMDYKSSGYGIFWATSEMMHEEGDRLEFDDITFGSIAKDLNEEVSLVKEVLDKCISKYKLFQKDDILLTSNRVKKNLAGKLERINAKSEAGRLGGIKSGESRKSKQNEAVLQADEAELEANEPIKENKEKKSKESKEEESKENTENKIAEIKKKDLSKYPLAENFNGLPEIKIGAAKELIRACQNTDATTMQIESFWAAFKIQNLTGENFYQSEDKVYSHFINWVKDKKINNATSNDKPGTSKVRVTAIKNW